MPNKNQPKGIALIWVALTIVIIVGFVGFTLDVAYGLWVAHQLQNAADAAALAGAQQVKFDLADTRQAAVDIALLNFAAGEPVRLDPNGANDPDGDVVIGRYSRETDEFTPNLQSPNAVKVVARRTDESLGGPVFTIFARIFGISTVNISREAVAVSGGGTGAGLIALNPEDRWSLRVHGTATLTVDGGPIFVNSDNTNAVRANGDVVIDAPELNVTGDARFSGGAEFEGDLNTGTTPIPDPLALLPAPTWSPASDLGTVSVTGNEDVQLVPGFYSGGISANNGTVTLVPGIYILDGEGLNITGNTIFTAEGVMFYITGTGRLDLTGTGDIRITPPDPDLYDYPDVGTYEGVSIFQDRDNTNEARIIGTSFLDLEGTLYFSSAKIELGGTGDGFGNQLIADKIEVGGTGVITINYDGRFPAPGYRSWLVK